MQPADEEAVDDAHQLAGILAIDVRFGPRLARRLKRRAIARDQRQALGACGSARAGPGSCRARWVKRAARPIPLGGGGVAGLLISGGRPTVSSGILAAAVDQDRELAQLRAGAE